MRQRGQMDGWVDGSGEGGWWGAGGLGTGKGKTLEAWRLAGGARCFSVVGSSWQWPAVQWSYGRLWCVAAVIFQWTGIRRGAEVDGRQTPGQSRGRCPALQLSFRPEPLTATRTLCPK